MKVTFEQLKAAFNRVLISRGVDNETADACAEMFARTTESGVYSHGVNRFPRFIQQLENGDIIPDAQPKRITSLGAIEQWDAQRSIGNLTAKKMMDRAIELAAITVLVWWHYVMPTTGCAAAATAGRRRKKVILAFAGPTPSP
ncbi:2,3-diketo-l-gulonate reductase [Escherichia coli]|nr:2,3-diketo-l-gulonate reductase [Escherichia coli]